MSQSTNSAANSARQASLARRKMMSSTGKASMGNTNAAPVRASSASSSPRRVATPVSVRPAVSSSSSARAASLARRQAMSVSGKRGVHSSDRVRTAAEINRSKPEETQAHTGCGETCSCGGKKKAAAAAKPAPRAAKSTVSVKTRTKPAKRIAANPTRAAALARRKGMSSRGKAGVSPSGISAAQTARLSNPDLSSRELAQTVREQRSRRGMSGQKKSAPVGRIRPGKPAGKSEPSLKVGVGETTRGQVVTGTMVGRTDDVTGNEASTCRPVTGTEYMGADVFREFCQTEAPVTTPTKVAVTSTAKGRSVSGTTVGRSQQVTGDEPGSCTNVTGTEYFSAEQVSAFCGTKPEANTADKITSAQTRQGKTVTGNLPDRTSRVTGDEVGSDRDPTGTQYMSNIQVNKSAVPPKVGLSQTVRGGSVSGSMVGRSASVTGDEAGSCRNVTGDDYLGTEHFESFCQTTPKAQDAKVGVSQTHKGESVTGTMTGRASRMTGDEPGTCSAITGTPYAGAEQYRNYCEPKAQQNAQARSASRPSSAPASITGLQPGIGGSLTGAEKGACETVSGTPYVGVDQLSEVCSASAAVPESADFPQTIAQQFSIASPLHAAPPVAPPSAAPPAAPQANVSSVTGSSSYESGHITGPFGMATGKVTGTEDSRFGQRQQKPVVAEPATEGEAVAAPTPVVDTLTGEGMLKRITGDDWDRGDRVTGTEGLSASRRNPSRQGGVDSSRVMLPPKRNDEVPAPVSRVTGSSGNSEKGSLITYSGGARG